MTAEQLVFRVLPHGEGIFSSHPLTAYLLTDNWDDWFTYSTMYQLVVFDDSAKRHEIGSVKIGQFGWEEKQVRPKLPTTFNALDETFFSLGQDDSYYEAVNALGDVLRDRILNSLNDLVISPSLYVRASQESVTTSSLMRSVSHTSVAGQFRRLASGGARLSKYAFSYQAKPDPSGPSDPVVLSFDVKPESQPPTNVHVLIGRNGVGKTYHLNQMARALLYGEGAANDYGVFSSQAVDGDDGRFANLISVTFSAFDPFDPLTEQKGQEFGIKYSYVGLKQSPQSGQMEGVPKPLAMLTDEFVRSVNACMRGPRGARWRKAVQTLEADPVFKIAMISGLADSNQSEPLGPRASALFSRLSSGHKIVLLTITRLIETVEERSLVLLDEPEAHLHPPLLSAFIRSLSDLLVNRNGVAIIATHSPVVLQEVPKSCVWKLHRIGSEAKVERPEIETFGENVSVLTREIFGLEVTHSGFHALIHDAVQATPNYEMVLQRFEGELGAEAQAIVRALVASRAADSGR